MNADRDSPMHEGPTRISPKQDSSEPDRPRQDRPKPDRPRQDSPKPDRPEPDDLHAWQARYIAHVTAQADDDGAHDIQHLHRVWGTARTLLADYPQADAAVVQAAAYLHDLVNLPKNHPDRARASTLAATRACEWLTTQGFDQARLPAVTHAIEAHSFSAGIAPRTIEAMIVQDADRMDALGAVGLARLFYIAGRMGSALAHPTDPLACHRPLDDKHYALDHIEVKLATLPASMCTEAARRLGAERLQWLRAYRDSFVAQWQAD